MGRLSTHFHSQPNRCHRQSVTSSKQNDCTHQDCCNQQPSTAPEGAVSNHQPSKHVQLLIEDLQLAFKHAKTHGLCKRAACGFAARNKPPENTGVEYIPPPHDKIEGSGLCDCKHDGHVFRLRDRKREGKKNPPPKWGQAVLGEKYKRSRLVELEANVRRLFAEQMQTTPERGGGGCSHYVRGCKLKANCCGLWVSCRLCHDEIVGEDHEMDRFATEEVMCMKCGHEQPVADSCRSCGHKFARYFCNYCKFYEDAPGKDIYHCNRCKICRLGKGLGIDNYHCDKCDACVSLESKDRHRCLSRSLHTNCPVCKGYLFTSTQKVLYMRCGHTMHAECFDNYTTGSYQCPLCMKSLTNMKKYFRDIDELVRREPMPAEYDRKRSEISCNDCGKRSVVKYHFQYHKCDSEECESYNTRVLRVIENVDEDSQSQIQPVESNADEIQIGGQRISGEGGGCNAETSDEGQQQQSSEETCTEFGEQTALGEKRVEV